MGAIAGVQRVGAARQLPWRSAACLTRFDLPMRQVGQPNRDPTGPQMPIGSQVVPPTRVILFLLCCGACVHPRCRSPGIHHSKIVSCFLVVASQSDCSSCLRARVFFCIPLAIPPLRPICWKRSVIRFEASTPSTPRPPHTRRETRDIWRGTRSSPFTYTSPVLCRHSIAYTRKHLLQQEE